MIKGIGVDLAQASRIEELTRRRGEAFLNRLFTPGEIEYCRRHKNRHLRLAGRFAAKEAFLKALGTGLAGGVSWLDIEVVSDGKKPPLLQCSGRTKGLLGPSDKIHLSLSHDGDYAVAQVVIEGEAR